MEKHLMSYTLYIRHGITINVISTVYVPDDINPLFIEQVAIRGPRSTFSKGAYRQLIRRPRNVTNQITKYDAT